MEFDKNIPIYVQIMDEIKRRVITGALRPGDKVPSVRDLADELQVNPNTIVRAFQELERQGITETRRGMGTFVSSDSSVTADSLKNERSLTEVRTFINRMHDAGVTDSEIILLVNQVLAANTLPAPDSIKEEN